MVRRLYPMTTCSSLTSKCRLPDSHLPYVSPSHSSPSYPQFYLRASPSTSQVASDSYLSETRFEQCSVFPLSLRALKDVGYEKMTMVQEATLPVILKGKDVLAKAGTGTGTGKTVAFLILSIEVVVNSPTVDRDQKRPLITVLIICPTWELASQAAKEANTLLKYHYWPENINHCDVVSMRDHAHEINNARLRKPLGWRGG